MDWSNVIIALITALIPTGGIVALFTAREKKTELMLDNASKVIEQWEQFAKKEEERRTELQKDLDKRDDTIDELRKEISELSRELDSQHTQVAVASLLRCKTIGCPNRVPPFGEGQAALAEGGTRETTAQAS